MTVLSLLVYIVALMVTPIYAYIQIRPFFHSHHTFIHCINSASDESSIHPSKATIQDNETKAVEKGLTHIKYNKYAPSAEEAVGMTDEEFRQVIYSRMKEDERVRRSKGRVGNAVSDDYLASLSKKKDTPVDE